jgi:hypothetical protein
MRHVELLRWETKDGKPATARIDYTFVHVLNCFAAAMHIRTMQINQANYHVYLVNVSLWIAINKFILGESVDAHESKQFEILLTVQYAQPLYSASRTARAVRDVDDTDNESNQPSWSLLALSTSKTVVWGRVRHKVFKPHPIWSIWDVETDGVSVEWFFPPYLCCADWDGYLPEFFFFFAIIAAYRDGARIST